MVKKHGINTITNPKTIAYFLKTKFNNTSIISLLLNSICMIDLVDAKRGIVRFGGSFKFDLNGWDDIKSEKYFK